MPNIKLKAEEIQKTLKKTHDNLLKTFPDASLNHTCETLYNVALNIDAKIKEINKPNYFVKASVIVLITLIAWSVIYSWRKLNINLQNINIADFVQMLDASFSFLVILGSGAFFLISYQYKVKKKRLIHSINKLTGLAHVIDAHQLSKDLTYNNLEQYLDYCSDLLALTSKIGFLYVQSFDDLEAQEIEQGLESLTSGISRKVWQKIMILQEKK